MDVPRNHLASSNKPGHTYLILLVEDNLNDEMLALRAFNKVDMSLHIEVARDGLEALEYLGNVASPVPDLVLLDLKLPKVNGLEVLNSIRSTEKTRRIPVVVFTSSNEQADVVGCFDAGANGFVRKSVDFEEYMEKISKLTDYWLNVNEPCV